MATKRKKPSKSTRALARRPIVQAPLAQLPKGAGDRRALGRSPTVEALFPAPPPKVELPSGYANVLGELKQRIEQTRLATVITANTAMTRLYWQIGRVIHARTLMHGKVSPVLHGGKGVFRGLPSPFNATRYHSLAIERETCPEVLEVTAWTEDGEIMGVRHRALAVEGVQFHPESILTEHGHDLLRNFLTQE